MDRKPWKRDCEVEMHRGIFACWLIGWFLVSSGCGRNEKMEPYPNQIGLSAEAESPEVMVGRILSSVPIGSGRLSPWEGQGLYVQGRATVAVENVLKGSVPPGTAEIYFVVHGQGHKTLGTANQGGSWRIGDREMFFLQRDAGRLRTICDSFAWGCVWPVLSGSHESLPLRPHWQESVVDILLTRGKGASDAVTFDDMRRTVQGASFLAPRYAMTKLEELAQTETPVRRAACKCLRTYSLEPPSMQGDYIAGLAKDPNFAKALAACPPDEASP
jgi:hypothetical protein